MRLSLSSRRVALTLVVLVLLTAGSQAQSTPASPQAVPSHSQTSSTTPSPRPAAANLGPIVATSDTAAYVSAESLSQQQQAQIERQQEQLQAQQHQLDELRQLLCAERPHADMCAN